VKPRSSKSAGITGILCRDYASVCSVITANRIDSWSDPYCRL